MDEILLAWLFWGTLSVTVYTYLGYPLILALLRGGGGDVAAAVTWPTATVIVAAHNEERCIAQKVQNVLEHAYPSECLDVIVVSDGSTDHTDAIVQRLEGPRVQLFVQPYRSGKNAALNRGVLAAHGDIVVFTDASALLTPEALCWLIAPFRDPQVGLVSGQGYYGEFGNRTTRVVSNAYVRYEAFIKRRESSLGFVAAADGALYAMRRSLYTELPTTYVHDLLHPIQMTLAGLRSVFVPDAYTVEPPSQDAGSEYRRHVRISAQGYLVFLSQIPVLCARGRLRVCWMLVSHRFLRWVSALLLLTALATNACLASVALVYTLCLAAQLVFYTCAVAGAIAEHWQLRLRLLAIPYYFCVVSLAGLGGFVSFLRGRRQIIWRPTSTTS